MAAENLELICTVNFIFPVHKVAIIEKFAIISGLDFKTTKV